MAVGILNPWATVRRVDKHLRENTTTRRKSTVIRKKSAGKAKSDLGQGGRPWNQF